MTVAVDDRSLAIRILRLPEDERWKLVRSLTGAQTRELIDRWGMWANDNQLLPGADWRVALIRAGRGFGKTRAGAEWVSQIARDRADARIALVGGTMEDVRRVMIEGESGILSVARNHENPKWHRLRGEITFDSGARAFVYSAAAGEALRGPQHHVAWCDELAKWRYGDKAWDNLLMGMGAAAAKTLAEVSLAHLESARERRWVSLDVAAASIAPGSLVTVAGESGRWQVVEAALESMVVELMLVREARGTLDTTATPGRVLRSPDRIEGPTILHAVELPPLGENALAMPRLSIVAAGMLPGWRRAALLYSLDDGASWQDAGVTAAPATMGKIGIAPPPASATLADLDSVMTVELARGDMTLHDADDRALDAGANLALAGDELLQFGRAEALGGSRWRLSHLWRGRRGTEAAAGLQSSGDLFVLIEPASIAAIDLPVAALGSSVRVLASGTGDLDGPATAFAVIAGRSVRPPSPVGLKIVHDESSGLQLRWTRRSRLGFRWIDGSDVPLVEEDERYRVDVVDPAGSRQVAETAMPALPLHAGEIASGSLIEVRQVGALALSERATILLS